MSRLTSVAGRLGGWGDSALSALFGLECVICAFPIAEGCWCEACGKLMEMEGPFCRRCGYSLAYEMGRCGQCWKGRELDSLSSLFWFEPRGRALWIAVKFHRRTELLRPLGQMIRQQILRRGLCVEEGEVIIPVPLPFARLVRRGLNQADWLASQFSKVLKIPVCGGRLVREGSDSPQSLLSRAGRHRNLKGAFRWASKRLAPAKIILVDDIFTTGATLRECARVLRRAGCEKVRSFTLYRTPLRGSVQGINPIEL